MEWLCGEMEVGSDAHTACMRQMTVREQNFSIFQIPTNLQVRRLMVVTAGRGGWPYLWRLIGVEHELDPFQF